jgi:hypothetical protein
MATLNAQQVKLLGFPYVYSHDAFVLDHPVIAAKLRGKVHPLLVELDMKENEIRTQADILLRGHNIQIAEYQNPRKRKREPGNEPALPNFPDMGTMVSADEARETCARLEAENKVLQEEVSNLLAASQGHEATSCFCTVSMREEVAALKAILKEYQRERDSWRGRYMSVVNRIPTAIPEDIGKRPRSAEQDPAEERGAKRSRNAD